MKHSAKIIDHIVVALYLNSAGTSTVKFGSYDEEGLSSTSDFTVMRTVTADHWTIPIEKVEFGDLANSPKQIYVDASIAPATNVPLEIDP